MHVFAGSYIPSMQDFCIGEWCKKNQKSVYAKTSSKYHENMQLVGMQKGK